MVATHPQCCHIRDGRGAEQHVVMCRWPYHTTTLYLVPLCSSVQFWLLSSVSPPLLLLPNVLPHTTLTWIPVKLSSCPECGWADPDPFTCFLPYYCCSVTGRQEGSSQPLPGKICELVEQFEGQPSGERREHWRQTEQDSFPIYPDLSCQPLARKGHIRPFKYIDSYDPHPCLISDHASWFLRPNIPGVCKGSRL